MLEGIIVDCRGKNTPSLDFILFWITYCYVRKLALVFFTMGFDQGLDVLQNIPHIGNKISCSVLWDNYQSHNLEKIRLVVKPK